MNMIRLTVYLCLLSAVCMYAADEKSQDLDYVLGAGDQVSVQVLEVPEFGNRPYRVEPDGTVGLPLVGRMKVEGSTLEQFESQLTTKLKKQVLNPHVAS